MVWLAVDPSAPRSAASVFTLTCRQRDGGRLWTFGPLWEAWQWPPEHQFGSQLFFIRSSIQQNPDFSLAWVRQWLPLGPEATCQLHCLDVRSGQELGRVELGSGAGFHFCEQHQLLISWGSVGGDPQELACWDVPFRPPWSWVLGPPLALGLLALAWHWWRTLSFSPKCWRLQSKK